MSWKKSIKSLSKQTSVDSKQMVPRLLFQTGKIKSWQVLGKEEKKWSYKTSRSFPLHILVLLWARVQYFPRLLHGKGAGYRDAAGTKSSGILGKIDGKQGCQHPKFAAFQPRSSAHPRISPTSAQLRPRLRRGRKSGEMGGFSQICWLSPG